MSDYVEPGLNLMLGDCLDRMKEIPDGSVDLVVTDPPYKVISGGTSSKLAAGWAGSVLSKNDGKIFEHNSIKPWDYMGELYRVLRAGSDAYIMTNVLNLRDTIDAAEHAGLLLHNLLIWEKNTCTANRWYMKNTELTLYLYKKPAKKINNPGSKQIFRENNPRNKVHPTEKPVTLMEHYIMNSTNPGEIVLDPFMGSGTTGIACIGNERRFIGIEQDEKYFEVAKNRILGQEESREAAD